MTKSVIITGGTKGIGQVIAEEFLDKGYLVAVGSRSGETTLKHENLSVYKVDVQDEKAVQTFIDQSTAKLKGLNVLVNCAGISKWRPLIQVDGAFLDEIFDTNVRGVFWTIKSSLKHMSHGGSIVNVSSLAGKRGSANNSVYCASKFALNGLTQSLAKELGPQNIRVNAVCPVYVETPTILHSLENSDSPAKGARVAEYLKEFSKTQTALGRLPMAKEVAQSVLFLAGEESSAITGQCVNVDCGTLPQ